MTDRLREQEREESLVNTGSSGPPGIPALLHYSSGVAFSNVVHYVLYLYVKHHVIGLIHATLNEMTSYKHLYQSKVSGH